MSFSDFYLNYAAISLCRFFDKEYTEIFFESEFSKAKATAGGCTNHESVCYNPQMKLLVKPKHSGKPVEVFMQLNLQEVSSQSSKVSLGF